MSSAEGKPYTLTVAFAANERYYIPLVGILDKIRSMKDGKTYRLVVHDLGACKTEARGVSPPPPPLPTLTPVVPPLLCSHQASLPNLLPS